MTGVKTNDPKVYAIAVPRSDNPARISGPIPSHKTYGPPTCAGRKGLDSHYPKESHNFMRRQAGGRRAPDRLDGGARHGPMQTDQPETALRYALAQPDSALFCVARQRGNWLANSLRSLQPQNGPKLPVRFSM